MLAERIIADARQIGYRQLRLETSPRDPIRVSRKALPVSVAGVVVPFVLGFAYMKLRGDTTVEAVFIAAAMVATSIGITASALAFSSPSISGNPLECQIQLTSFRLPCVLRVYLGGTALPGAEMKYRAPIGGFGPWRLTCDQANVW